MTDQQFTQEEVALLEADAAEAEQGYSLEFLRTRRRVGGRPREIGEEAAIVVQFRLDPDRVSALDQVAARNHETRSDVIRRAVEKELATA